MAHINSYRDRQYFDSQISGNEVSEGIKKVGETFVNTFNTGLSAVEKANESTLSNYSIDLSTNFLAKNNEINTKYQADPTNPERETELQQAFDTMAEDYQINPLCKKQWNEIKSNVYNRYKMYNAHWAEDQLIKNTQNNLKDGYEKLNNQISMLGMNGSGVDEMRLIYANGIEALRQGAVAGLGEVYVNEFLKDSDHDIMATYISALALNNPLIAQKLMQDEGVQNDIGKAETIEKLNDYISNSLTQQSKRVAVNELCSALRTMNSEDADNILNGNADLNKIMKFVETNKNLPEGSKDLLLGIYDIRKRSDYYYDKDKKKIVKDEEKSGSGSGGNKIKAAKMTAFDKQKYAEFLEQDLHNLISFSSDNLGNIDVKQTKNNLSNQQKASSFAIGYMERVAQMQGQIDSAYSAGIISKEERKRMMNDYLAPVTDYIESNLSQLDESNWKREKLGYDQIKQYFSSEGMKNKSDIAELQRQKLFAQNYYLDELNQIVNKIPNLKNIYGIESLPSRQQQEIYKTAAKNAINRAQRWTDKPEYFFAKEYPAIYAEPFTWFNKLDAAAINHVVAQEVYNRKFENPDGTSNLELIDFAKNSMINEINNKAKQNRIKAGETFNSWKDGSVQISRPMPQNMNEFNERVKALGISPEEFIKQAEKRGFGKLSNILNMPAGELASKQITGKINPMAGYFVALQEAEHAKAKKDKEQGK